MKVLETTTYQYLLPNHTESFGKVGSQVYGTLVGAGKETAMVNLEGKLFTMDASLVKDKKEGDSLAFEITGIFDGKISLKYLQEESLEVDKTIYTSVQVNGHMKTSEVFDIIGALENKQDSDKSYNQEVKDYVEGILSKATEEDLEALAKEGYNSEKMTLKDLSHAVTKIKEGGASSETSQDQIERLMDQFSHLTNNAEQLKAVIKKLKAAQMPVNQYTLKKALNAVNQLGGSLSLSQGAMAYLMKQEGDVTLGELYKANHMNEAYLSSEKGEKIDFEALEGQIANRLSEIGIEANDVSIDKAKWLIENEIPMTEKTLDTYDQLNQLKDIPLSHQIDIVVNGLKAGKKIKDIQVIGSEETRHVSDEAVEKVREQVAGIKDQQIRYAIQEEKPLTIQSINEVNPQELAIEIPLNQNEEQAYLTAKRQVEEIRLKLTYDAARRLLKQGIEIETKPLEQVVETLKQMEEAHYLELYNSGNEGVSKEQVGQLQSTLGQIEDLKGFPMTLLGRFVNNGNTKNLDIEQLYEAGYIEKQQLEKAQETYETLMTVPRKDLGDRLSKTYDQIEPLLTEMGLEHTQANIRAVKILSYHQMDLTESNINQVKALDAQVNQILENLHPATILEMIKSGQNPLHVSIDDLMVEIEKFQEELGITSQEKVSTYLLQMEKAGAITEEEKEGLIGIYRLLKGIEKSEGKVISYLMKTDQAFTLKNLLTATRMLHNKTVDVSVDEQFGLLEGLKGDSLNIEEQIEKAFSSETVKQEVTYQKTLLERLKEVGTPERLYYLSKTEDIKNLSLEALVEALENIEMDLDQEMALKEENLQYERLQQLQNIKQETLSFMERFEMPLTLKNILNVQTLLEEQSGLEKTMKKAVTYLEPSQKEKMEGLLSRFLDMTEETDVSEGLEELKEEINTFYKSACVNELPREAYQTFEQVEALMGLQSSLKKQHFFQVPLLIEGQITQMNVQLVQGEKEHQQEVLCSFELETFGPVKGRMELKDDGIEMEIQLTSKEGAEQLADHLEQFKNIFSDMGHKIRHLNLQGPINRQSTITRASEGHYDFLI